MDFKAAIGLLGLSGIAVLILIYIIKPNYQQKFVSSSYVWKLSLKYRKRRLPISKFKNILIIICQILIITMCGFILAQPFIANADPIQSNEKIVIIDASANMQALCRVGDNNGNITRFNKAVNDVRILGQETFLQEDGLITLILAGKEAEIVLIADTFNSLSKALDEIECTFGSADIDGAMALAEKALADNPVAEILLYTATVYKETDKVKVKNISNDEWNAAVLDCTTFMEENYYTFAIKVASYNKDTELLVAIDIYDANYEQIEAIHAETTASCFDNQPDTVNFRYFSEGIQISSFNRLHISIKQLDGTAINDSFSYDNDYYIYGGKKKEIKILYVSPLRNAFFGATLMNLRDKFSSSWDIVIQETTLENAPEFIGFDFYIFEHEAPRRLPLNGFVLLIDPDSAPQNSGIVLGEIISKDSKESENFVLSSGEPCALSNIIKYVDPPAIEISRYTKIIQYSEGFSPLLFQSGNPVFLVKDQEDSKIAVLSFSLHYSNLALLMDFPILLYNLFEHFVPPTITKYVYNVYDSISINARGPELVVRGPGINKTIKNLPTEISLSMPGIYSLTQRLMSGDDDTEFLYVKITESESDFKRVGIFEPLDVPPQPNNDLELMFYFAIALFSFLIFERLLHVKKDTM